MINPAIRTITELVAAARLGDDRAVEALVQRLEPTIERIARNWRRSIPNVDVEDLQQEGRLQLLAAISNWDERRSSFEVWCSRLMTNRLRHLAEAAGRQKRGGGYPSISLSQPVGWDADADQPLLLGDLVGSPGPEAELLDRLDLERRLSPLAERQQAVARLLMLGYSQTEIARTLNLSIDAVRCDREKIAAVLSEEE